MGTISLFLGILLVIFSLALIRDRKESFRIVLENVSANTGRVMDSITRCLNESTDSVQILASFVPSSALSGDSSVWYFFYRDLQTTIGLLESSKYQTVNLHYFVYNHAQDYFLRGNTHSVNVYEEKELGNLLRSPEAIRRGSWQDLEICDTHYYIYTLKKGDFTTGVFVPASAILERFTDSSSDRTEFILTGDKDRYCLSDTLSALTPEELKRLGADSDRVSVAGREWAVRRYTGKVGFSVIALIPRTIFRSNSLLLTGTIILVSGLMIFIFYIITLSRCIKPLTVLRYAFSRVISGDLTFRMREDMFSREYNELAVSFNMMVREIKDLRMNYYEGKILEQQAENRYLRAITYPHFLLNNLSLINNFAYDNNEQGIHDVVLNLSRYLRYFITADYDRHTLRNDLESARSYLDLNALAYPGRLTYAFDADEELQDIWFPPLIISTIVENCIKHGLVPGEALKIDITLRRDTEGDTEKLLFICLNSGPGFPQEIVDNINCKETPEVLTTHIGLMSIKKTLLSQYRDHVVFRLDNTDSGAMVSIRLDMSEVYRTNAVKHKAKGTGVGHEDSAD